MNLNNEFQMINEKLENWYKYLHMNPELSMKEYKTTDFIVDKLKEIGIDEVTKIDKTGVIATIYGQDRLNGVALRADIDALPVNEDNDLEFKSQTLGVSHACGHDIHTVSLLGASLILNKYKQNLKKSVRLIFQPAEEIGKGAQYIIENGGLDNLNLSSIIALHSWPDQLAGNVYFRSGKICASADRFKITIHGSQGHAAHPHKSIDPIIIAGNIICAVQSIISREISPLESNVITLATIHGGTKDNIISNMVEITGTIRALTPDSRDYIHNRLTEIVEKISETYRGKGEVSIDKGQPPLINDEDVCQILTEAILEVIPKENFILNPNPSMGSEDFSYYTEIVKGAMFRIGCGYEDSKNYPLHSNMFKANYKCIETGVKILINSGIKLMD